MLRPYTLYMDETGNRRPDKNADESRAGRDWFGFGGILVKGEDNDQIRHMVTSPGLPQRTRWFKGWFQTWLVHMRDPVRLLRELGPGSFLLAQILFAGMLISALFHPFLVLAGIYLAATLMVYGSLSTWQSAMFAVDIANVACGYASFILLGWQALRPGEKRSFWQVVAFTPVYWVLMSVAAWRSVFLLWRRPHEWEKTPHRPTRRQRFENFGPAGGLTPSADPARS